MKKVLTLLSILIFFSNAQAQSTTICAGSNANLFASNPSNLSNPTYSLSPNTTTNTSGNFVVSPTVTTNYTLYTIGMDTNNVTIATSVALVVYVNAQPSAAPTVTQSTCTNSLIGFNLNLSFIPNSSPYSIYWSTIPIGIFTSAQTSVAAANIIPGPYSATITAAGGCSVVSNFIVNPLPASAQFTTSPDQNFNLNCYTPSIAVSASPTSLSYTWQTPTNTTLTGTSATINQNQFGSWTITATNQVSGCMEFKIFNVFQNTVTPSTTLTPLSQTISCIPLASNIVTVYTSNSSNLTTFITSPHGAIFSYPNNYSNYKPYSVGTYTHCAMDNYSGCKTCKTFSVSSVQNFPTFSLTSAQNFSIGCSTKSIVSLQIINAATTPSIGSVSYTLLSPSTSTTTNSGSLSNISSYTVNSSTTYTVVVKDNVSFCETRAAFTISNNAIPPGSSILPQNPVLNCTLTQVSLTGMSSVPNASFNWLFSASPGAAAGNTLNVNSLSGNPTNSIVGQYSLTVTNPNNLCKNTISKTVYQNLFPPKAKISTGGISEITCLTPSLLLVNQSISGIPMSTGFPTTEIIAAWQWLGPSLVESLQLSSTYTAYVAGTYTLVAKDLNNACKSQTTILVIDNRIYPQINMPGFYFLPCPGTVMLSSMVNNTSAGMTFSWNAPPTASVSSNNSPSIITNSPGYYYVLVTNTITGCATTASTVVQACVGLNDKYQLTNQIFIFPNPNNGIFKIQCEHVLENAEVEIFNSTGQLVKKLSLSDNANQFNLEDLQKGLYVVTIKEKNKLIASQKLILN